MSRQKRVKSIIHARRRTFVPFAGDESVARILIGGILSLLGILILPGLIVNGYLLRVLETTVEGAEEPPAFEEWGELLVGGLKFLVVGVVYAIVPFAAFDAIATVIMGAGAAAGGDGGGIIAGFGLVTMLLMLPAMIIVYYFLPAALTNMAIEGRLGAAFDFGTLTDVCFTGSYFVAVLMPIVVAVILNVVTFVLAITVVGLLLVPFVQFYAQVAIFRMFGTAFADVKGTNRASGAAGTAPV